MLTSTGKNIFTTAYVLFLIIGCFLFYNYSKPELELALNQYNTPYFDFFFKYYTYVGDAIIFIIANVVILIFNRRNGALMAIAGILQMIIVRGLKWYVFPSAARPAHYLANVMPNYPVHYVDGVVLHSFDSIPSGHAATAFTMFTMIVLLLISHKPLLSFLCFLAALLVGISRVYLMQHFVFDIYFGSLIGVLSAFFVYKYAGKYLLNTESKKLE